MPRANRVSVGRFSPARSTCRFLGCLSLAVVLTAPVAGAAEFGQPILLGSLDPQIDRSFGAAVAIDGDTLAIGAPWSPEGGVVYIYERQRCADRPWGLVALVTGRNPEDSEEFGAALALEGDTLVVGAPHESSRGSVAGAAYVFYRDKGGRGRWGLARQLIPKDLKEDSYYGFSISLSGDRLAVGAPGLGRVYVHERHRPVKNLWGIQADLPGRLTAPAVIDHFGITGEPPFFGAEVALNGRTLAAGAIDSYTKYGPHLIRTWSYGVFSFELDDEGVAWRQRRHFESPALRRDGKRDLFGATIGLDGSLLLIGDGESLETGCHLFERQVAGQGRWGRRTELRDTSGDFGRGRYVDLRGNTAAMVGHFSTDEDPFYGKGALVYERHVPTRNQWSAVAQLLNPEVIDSARAVAIGPREVVLGHPYPGVVQIFPRSPMVAADFDDGEITGVSHYTGNLEVVRPGLDGSDHALAVIVDSTSRISLVRARQPIREPSVSLGFDLAANRVGLADRRVEVMNLYGPSRDLVRLTLEADAARDQYWATLWAWEASGRWREVGRARMPPKRAVRLEIDWRAATGPGANDGRIRMRTDGRLRAQALNLDTGRQVINGLLLGLPKGSKGTQGGEFLLDEIELHR